ncbi:hypothetical protein [Methylocystis parvus]|uniref:SPOR domain-containing protein n=1 Tax=Methylocystis parvus TaxID=134 RepID=A0A6B8M120_9HYPH|nr:hypothetical protein [Methylocystis parvus]QGM97494.1 hypothetical protein F7D14_08475 [Methylocystis parvus]WBJ98585.1 hypothetical protein MMG94_11125 [Methylocystis parvus OBBP]
MRKNLANAIVRAAFLFSCSGSGLAAGLRLEGGERWVVLTSKQDKAEAVEIARDYGRSISGVRVFRSNNGWFAVVLGPLAVGSIDKARNVLEPRLRLNADAYLSRGERYAEAVFDAPPSPILEMVEYKGERPAKASYEGVAVILDSLCDKEGNRSPTLRGETNGETFFARIDESPAVEGQTFSSRARFIRLDPHSPKPQVAFSYFWGGAHCCTVTRIATALESGKWRILAGETLDGDGYEYEDVDGDGSVELLSRDNSFLYAFDSYASSFAPPKAHRLSGDQLRDVTGEAGMRPYLQNQLARMEGWARQTPELWATNGFLAGWVAAKAQLGAFDDAWRRMLRSYDRKSEWPLEKCALAVELDKCPSAKRQKISFPEALRDHLVKRGYVPATASPKVEDRRDSSPSR